MTDADRRPARPTMQEYRAVVQPPEVLGRQTSEHWLGDLYQRRVSPHLSRPLALAGVSPNAVTGAMIIVGAAGAIALVIPGLWGVVLAAVLIQAQMQIDAADGEVARWSQRFSAAGIFLDKVGHYTAESLMALCLGIRAAGGLRTMDQHYGYVALGAIFAMVLLLNKALNEMVHVARAFTGLGRLPESRSVSVPHSGLLARLRAMAGYVPIHRIFHSVEMSLLFLLVTLVAVIVSPADGSLAAARWLVMLLTPLAALSLLGHFLAILTSSRLERSA